MGFGLEKIQKWRIKIIYFGMFLLISSHKYIIENQDTDILVNISITKDNFKSNRLRGTEN